MTDNFDAMLRKIACEHMRKEFPYPNPWPAELTLHEKRKLVLAVITEKDPLLKPFGERPLYLLELFFRGAALEDKREAIIEQFYKQIEPWILDEYLEWMNIEAIAQAQQSPEPLN